MYKSASVQAYYDLLEKNSKLHSEIDRLKGLIEEAYKQGEQDGLHNYQCGQGKERSFEDFIKYNPF